MSMVHTSQPLIQHARISRYDQCMRTNVGLWQFWPTTNTINAKNFSV